MKLRKSLVIGGAGALLVALGLAATALFTTDQAPAPSLVEFSPDAAQRRKLAELVSELGPGEKHFGAAVKRQRENAKLFMYLAGTSDEPAVVLASLDAIQAAYSSRSGKKEAPDRDLDRVLIKHLYSERPDHAEAAFAAARIPLMTEGPSAELVAAVVGLARSGASPGVRLAAVQALDLLRPRSRSPAVLAAFLQATDKEPALVATALAALSHSGPSLTQAADLASAVRKQAEQLTAAADGGIRGSALELLAASGDAQTSQATALLLRTHLTDADPYVRGVAAAALGQLGEASDVHRLMPLIDDLADARATVGGIAGLDGTEAKVPLSVPGRRQVAESALVSVRTLAERWGGAPPPRLSIGGHGLGAEGIQSGREQAHAWYDAQKDQLPSAR